MSERINFSDQLNIVGARIRALRQAKGLSQEELADQAGCHRTYVGMLERGQSNPSLAILFRVAEVLDVGIVDLLIKSSG